MDARVDDVCIHDLYELVRERLKADDVYGLFVDPEEHPSQNAGDVARPGNGATTKEKTL